MIRDIILWLCVLFPLSLTLEAQDTASTVQFNGYLSGMPQYTWSKSNEMSQVLLHNRLNFKWYPTDNLTGTIQFRNQVMYGDFVKLSALKDGFQKDGYFLPLTYTKTFNDKGLMYMATDRMWMKYSYDNLDIKLGRQRINWGQTFAWNPNDIFNSYNFFDFDYVEKPGADAFRMQYYPSYTSTIDIAAKIDSANNITAAALYKLNFRGFDFQFIGGYYSQPAFDLQALKDTESDIVGGFGFTTDFKGVSLRSETTYLKPTNNSPNQNDLLLISIGIDYNFVNQLFFATEYFYSSRVALSTGSGFLELNSQPTTIKSLAFAKNNFFAQASFPFTPLFKAAISGMVFTDQIVTGFFIGPNLDYSIRDNLDLSLYFQSFRFKVNYMGTSATSNLNFAFLRLKWSF